MGVHGELNFTKCGNKITISASQDLSWVDIRIGNTVWLILTLEQARTLKERLNKEVI